MAEAKIVREVIEAGVLEAQVSDPAFGAVCTFIGQTRNNAKGREVASLFYDAYIPMAEKMLLKIAEEAETRWECRIVVQHRIGEVPIGQASVVIAVGSAHRAAAFEACRWCIDTLKADVPIWKKETCPDGTYWIEGENALAATGSPS